LRASLANLARQRLFPVLTALWFAALFGLGGVAASGDVLAAIVLHLHLPAILPAAAPPLGTTAHGLIAVALAGVGAIAGLAIGFVAWRRAGGHSDTIRTRPVKPAAQPREQVRAEPPVAAAAAPRVRNRDAHPDAPPRRPLVVTEDVIPYHAPVSPAAIAMPDEPPAEPSVAAIHPVVIAPAWVAAELAADNDSTGELHDRPEARFGSFFTDPSPAASEVLPPFFAGAFGVETDASPGIGLAEPGVPDAQPGVPDQQTPPAAPVSLACQAAVAPQAPIGQVPVGSLGLVQLIERLALAIADRQGQRAAREPVGTAVARGAFAYAGAPATDPADQRMPLHRFDPLTMDPGGPLLRAKPARLGRIRDHDAGDIAEEHHALDADHDPVAASLHDPLGRTDPGHADWAVSEIDLPPRFLGGPAGLQRHRADGSADDDDGDQSAPVDGRYSSLINMAMPRPELVGPELVTPHIVAKADHLDDLGAHDLPPAGDPVVHFPFASARPPVAEGEMDEYHATCQPRARIDDADRALRDALATLRRMSVKR
jgi:hypothetical protein